MIVIMSNSLFDHLHARSTFTRSIPKDGFLFHRDDEVADLFVVMEGIMCLARFQIDGKMAVLQRAAAQTVLAEASVFSDQYHCDAVAIVPSKVSGIPVRSIRDLLANDAGFALAWAKHLSAELQDSRRRSEIAGLKTVSARLNAWIAWNGGDPGRGDWSSVAREIAVSPEALYRELAKRRPRGES